ncbi:hypothetical protein Bca101_009196 [Brassica carinata]
MILRSGSQIISSVRGVPTECWCGNGITTYVSKTRKNPNRRFFRCNIAVERKGEYHLFKWVDEACNEEILLEEARQRTLLQEFEGLTMPLTDTPDEVETSKAKGCVGIIKLLCNTWNSPLDKNRFFRGLPGGLLLAGGLTLTRLAEVSLERISTLSCSTTGAMIAP